MRLKEIFLQVDDGEGMLSLLSPAEILAHSRLIHIGPYPPFLCVCLGVGGLLFSSLDYFMLSIFIFREELSEA